MRRGVPARQHCNGDTLGKHRSYLSQQFTILCKPTFSGYMLGRISCPSSQPPGCQQCTHAAQPAVMAQLRRQCAASGCRLNLPGTATTACRRVAAGGSGAAATMNLGSDCLSACFQHPGHLHAS